MFLQKSHLIQNMDIKWIEMEDVIKRDYNKMVWIPLCESKGEGTGEAGYDGSTTSYKGVITILVDNGIKDRALNLHWTDFHTHDNLEPYFEDGKYIAIGNFEDISKGVKGEYLVREQFITSEARRIWHLNPDLIFALELINEDDSWVCPKDDYVEVVRLKRNKKDEPALIEIRNEYLKDYLCARNSGLFVSTYERRGFYTRNLIESELANQKDISIEINNGIWKGHFREVHEGGGIYGEQIAVFHSSRTDVDFDDDVPELKGEPTDGNIKGDSWKLKDTRSKIFNYSGEVWKNEWINTGENSPRVRKDELPSQAFFKLDSKGIIKNADNLNDQDGWLWFRPELIIELLSKRKSHLEWHTEDTGTIGANPSQHIHFGVNRLGLINVFSEDIYYLSELYRKIFSSYNIGPDGKVAKELLMSQVDAKPASTVAPETKLFKLVEAIDITFSEKFGFKLFKENSIKADIYLKIHRFVSINQSGLYKLASELNKYILERIDIGNFKKLIPNSDKLGSIKQIENILNKLELNGRKMTSILGGLYDLRIADTHIEPSDLSESLDLAGITLDKPYPIIGKDLIENVAYCLNEIGRSIEELSDEFIKQKLPSLNPK